MTAELLHQAKCGTPKEYSKPGQIQLVTQEGLKGWVTLRVTHTSPERIIVGEKHEEQRGAGAG